MLPKTLLALLSLSVALVAAPLYAQEDAPAKEQPAEKKTPKYPKRYDTNKDGIISEEEIAAGKAADKAKRAAKRQADLAKYDANGDGKLNKEERAQMKADRDAEREQKRLAREAKQREVEARKAERAAKKKEREAQQADADSAKEKR